VKRETDFFVQTAQEHGLDIRPNGTMPIIDESNGLGEYEEVTRAYCDFLWGTGAGGSVEEGLVLLWGMEKVCLSFHLYLDERENADDKAYFEAWSFAKSHTSPISDPTETQKALEKFVDNWTCDEFVGFVDHCKEVVDGLELENDQEMSKRCEQVSTLQYKVYQLTV